LQNENTINTDPLLSNAVGGVKLFVKSEDVLKSKQILSSISEYSVDDKGELLSCPNCGAQKIEFLTTIKDFTSLINFIFGILLSIFHSTQSINTDAKTVNLNFN